MRNERRSREWWSKTVSRWRRSGLTGREFATQEGLAPSTLAWWSSTLSRDTRAAHGLSTIEPIEIVVQPTPVEARPIEIAVAGSVVRCEVGTSVEYVASLVRALGGG